MTLTVTDLCIARAGVPVLQALSFGVAPGQALVLRGPNGIGKTTLLRTIAGLQPPLSGYILVDDQAVAYAGHADGIKSTLTVGENLGFWAQVFGTNKVADAVSGFNLAALVSRPAAQLSAGQKRRLGLARLLVSGRAIWALDEPTVSLDSAAVQMFAHAIAAHLAKGGSALIATHVDLGLQAATLDLTPYRAKATAGFGAFDGGLE